MLNDTVIANLQKAREIITPEDKWCAGLRWRNTGSGYAHCALGAIEAAQGNHRENQAESCDPEVVALAAAIPAKEKRKTVQDGYSWRASYPNDCHVAQYNNRSDHKTVLAWFDRAIEHLKRYPMEVA